MDGRSNLTREIYRVLTTHGLLLLVTTLLAYPHEVFEAYLDRLYCGVRDAGEEYQVIS
jgi:hypothetical protein